MSISRERLAELADLPESAIDASDIPEADEAFFRAAKSRQPKALNVVPSVEVGVSEQKAASVRVKGS